MQKIFIVASILFISVSSFALQCPGSQSPGGVNVYRNIIDCESGMSANIFSATTPNGEKRCLVNHSSAPITVDRAYWICWKPTGPSNLTIDVLKATPYR